MPPRLHAQRCRQVQASGARVIVGKSPVEFAVFMKEQNTRFARVARQIGDVTE